MSLSTAELEEVLRLALAALRAQAGAVSAAPAAALAEVLPNVSHGRTLGDWLDVYDGLMTERDYKPQTLKNRRANLAHVRRLWGARMIRDLRPHEVSSALREFLPARSSTAQRVLAALRDVYTEAVANDWAEHNPASPVRQIKHKVKRGRLTLETWQAMRTLAQTGPQQWVEPMLLLALVTGQRRADLAKMRFDDVNDGHVRIEQQKQAGKGYGARVEIPLTLRMDAVGMTVGDVIERCRSAGKPGPTLLRKAGGGAIEESSLSARFHEHILAVRGAEAHKLHEWPSLHECRSLAARLYCAQGVDVQTLLGHRAAEMTAIYINDRGLSAKEWKRVGAPSPPVAA